MNNIEVAIFTVLLDAKGPMKRATICRKANIPPQQFDYWAKKLLATGVLLEVPYKCYRIQEIFQNPNLLIALEPIIQLIYSNIEIGSRTDIETAIIANLSLYIAALTNGSELTESS